MARSHTRPKAGSSPRSLPLVPIALVVIVVLGIVAIALSRGENDAVPEGIEQTRPVEVEGQALPEFGDPPDRAVGMEIPTVSGETFDGTPLTITPAGAPKLIMFMAHWCPHCQNEIPVIQDWIDESGMPEGVELVTVSTGVAESRPNYPPSAWFEREGWTVPVLVDDEANSASQAFGLSAFPFFVAVDSNGRVVARTSGELEVAQLEALVSAARGG